jgi:DnaJ family protein C protein 2
MEKENKKSRDKHAKKERSRLIKLVELAYKYDPRIKAHTDREEAEKLRKKEEVRLMKEKARLEIEEKIKQ